MPACLKLMTIHDRALASVDKRIKETETRAAAYDQAGLNHRGTSGANFRQGTEAEAGEATGPAATSPKG